MKRIMDMDQEKKRINVTLNGAELTCPVGISLGELLQGHGHGSMPCGGHGKCGKCRVTVTGEVSFQIPEELLHLQIY